MIVLIRKYVEQGLLTPQECTQGQDDMVCVSFVVINDFSWPFFVMFYLFVGIHSVV